MEEYSLYGIVLNMAMLLLSENHIHLSIFYLLHIIFVQSSIKTWLYHCYLFVHKKKTPTDVLQGNSLKSWCYSDISNRKITVGHLLCPSPKATVHETGLLKLHILLYLNSSLVKSHQQHCCSLCVRLEMLPYQVLHLNEKWNTQTLKPNCYWGLGRLNESGQTPVEDVVELGGSWCHIFNRVLVQFQRAEGDFWQSNCL